MTSKILIALSVPLLLRCTGDRCDGPCTVSNVKRSALMKTNAPNLSCKLTTPELQKRKETTIANLKSLVQEKKEIQRGYSFRFPGDDNTIDLLAEFVKSERQCCDFFDFDIHILRNSTVWLDITGPDGTRDFITGELDM